MELNCLEIVGTESYILSKSDLNSYKNYFVNGQELVQHLILTNTFKINKSDSFQFCSRDKDLSHYQRNEEIITIEDFKNKPTYYDRDSSDEEVLRRIANKKELEGYEKVFKEPELNDIKLKVIGYIEETKSSFILSSIGIDYRDSVKNSIYQVLVSQIALDEFNKLALEYKDQASFYSDPGRNYLGYQKINGNYCFTRSSYPFGEQYKPKIFYSLIEAQKEESNIREKVKNVVDKYVFGTTLSKNKELCILSQLVNINKLESKESIHEMLNILINDISNHLHKIKE